MNLRLLVILNLILFASCHNQAIHRVYSPDKKHCITIFDFSGTRFIVAGDVQSIPTSNYIKLSVDPRVAENDEFAGCWDDSGFEWRVFIQDAIILENKLDSNRFSFSNKLPIDSVTRIPTIKPFNRDKCFHFGFSRFIISPKGNAIIE